jgi:hypothetical protein
MYYLLKQVLFELFQIISMKLEFSLSLWLEKREKKILFLAKSNNDAGTRTRSAVR